MKLCLDTNAYSAFKKGNQELTLLLENADEILIPVTVLGELYAGFLCGNRSQANLIDLNSFLEAENVTAVSTTSDVAERYGHLVAMLKKQGTPISTNDIWIAATALETSSRLVTYDADFNHIAGLAIYSPIEK